MKKTKLISCMLTAALITSAVGTLSVFAENDPIVYTYTDEAGETVSITQSELDAEHWNVDALGETAPFVYKDFPMSIESFVNDLGEQSLDLVYMKNIGDFTNVNLSIESVISEEEVFDGAVEQNSFYSPVLDVNDIYLVTITEELNNQVSEYKRIVQTQKVEAEMPSYVYNGTDEQKILIGDIEDLRAAQTITSDGEIIIDGRTSLYDKVEADDFAEYCNSLETGHTYRVYAKEDGVQYNGFIDGNDTDYIYDYSIVVSDYDALYSANTLSTPSTVSYSRVVSNATAMGFEDCSFSITDGSADTSKYRSFSVELSDYLLEDIADYDTYYLKTTIRGDVSLGVYMWLDVDGTTYSVSITAETGAVTRNISINLKSATYGITADSYVTLYTAVYFPTATKGYGMISSKLLQGYEDDITGSMYEALQDTTTPSEVSTFTEYTATGGMDVDAFYLKGIADCYKVSIRNRSASEQTALENGTLCTGSKEKYLTTYTAEYSGNSQATNATNVIDAAEYGIYTVPKNADMTVYCPGSSSTSKAFFTVRQSSLYTTSVDKYQISYTMMGNDDSVIED